jgi:hypothetical protein
LTNITLSYNKITYGTFLSIYTLSLPRDLTINPLKTVTLPSTVITIVYSTRTCIKNAVMNEIVAAAAPKSHSLTT